MKYYPSKKELKTFWWYRLILVLRLVITCLAFFAPLTTDRINLSDFWYIDGIVSALLWYFILWIIWIIVKYIIFGSLPKNDVKKKNKKEEYDLDEMVNKKMNELGLDPKKDWQKYYQIKKEIENSLKK